MWFLFIIKAVVGFNYSIHVHVHVHVNACDLLKINSKSCLWLKIK